MSLALSAALSQTTSIYISRARFSFSLLLPPLKPSSDISSIFSVSYFCLPIRSLSFSLLLSLSPSLSQLIGAYELMNADRSRPDTMRSPIVMLLYLWLVVRV